MSKIQKPATEVELESGRVNHEPAEVKVTNKCHLARDMPRGINLSVIGIP